MVSVEEHLGLVHHLAKKFQRTHEGFYEYEDLVSAGNLGLCKAAIKFNKTLGFKFSTFAGRFIIGEMKQLVMGDKHNYKRKKGKYERVFIASLNERVAEKETKEKIELIEDFTDEFKDVDLKATFDIFGTEEKEILELYFNHGYTQKEIAEVYKTTQISISRKIRRCLNKLKEAMWCWIN